MTKESKPIDALVIFVDARGFTSWAEKAEAFPLIGRFGIELQRLIADVFKDNYVKNLGDGAMIIEEITQETTEKFLKGLLSRTLRDVYNTEKAFKQLCKRLSVGYGCQIPLSLGWGITKGQIEKVGNDYIGADINKSARLCQIAKPFGVAIDRDDFPTLPIISKSCDLSFYKQVRKLKGIDHDIHVWVTKEIATQFITRESLKQTPEVHVAGICLKNEGGTIQVLIAKRNSSRKLFPDLYEGCGGQLARNETFMTGVKRHYKLELGIDIEVIEANHKFYYIHQPDEPIIPGIEYLCLYKDGEPHSENHSEVKWVTEEELRRIPEEKFIQGLKEKILEFIEIYKRK